MPTQEQSPDSKTILTAGAMGIAFMALNVATYGLAIYGGYRLVKDRKKGKK